MGCTEIPILLEGVDVGMPKFDTTQIHCQAAIERSLA
jgi:aspartate racemase